MCEYTVRLHDVLNRMGGRAVEDYFPIHVTRYLSFDRIRKGYCPYCWHVLLPNELRPSGRSTRSLCTRCYHSLIGAVPVEKCIICGDHLPYNKIQLQQINKREIAHYIHEDSCRDYFTLIHSAVVSEASALKTQQLPNAERLDLQELERARRRLLDTIQSSLKTIQMTPPQLPQRIDRLLPVPDSGSELVPVSLDRKALAKDDVITIDLPIKAVKPKH